MPEPFAVHPDNPTAFTFRGKALKLLTSAEHYGAVLNGKFDYAVYLKEMARTGQNGTRVFTFYRETAESIPGPGDMNTLAPTPEAAVMPWARVEGRGRAADGLGKFDLARWHEPYFQRMRDYLARCDEAGVVCEIVLFCNPYDQAKYDLFPCSRESNVNGVGGDLRRPQDFLTLEAPSVVAFQERFVRKLVGVLNPFDNFYWEICNEPNLAGDASEEAEQRVVAWHARIARVVREAETGLPKRHLIAANAHSLVRAPGDGETRRHEDLAFFENPDIDIVNYHYLSAHARVEDLRFVRLNNRQARAGLIRRFLAPRRRFGKPMVFDETFSGVVRGEPERTGVIRAEAWETLLSGGAGYSNLDWSFVPGDETGSGRSPLADGRRLDWRPLREWLAVFRGVLGRYDLSSFQPADGLVRGEDPEVEAVGAADGEGRYLIYLVAQAVYRLQAAGTQVARRVLSLPAGTYRVAVLDPRTGLHRDLGARTSDGELAVEVPGFEEDAALLLERVTGGKGGPIQTEREMSRG